MRERSATQSGESYTTERAMILLIDSYDSFSNNLYAQLKAVTHKDVFVLQNDAVPKAKYDSFLAKYLDNFEYIVIGPGPGHPGISSDVGIIPHVFKYARESEMLIPILGICLGFQCLCFEFGSEVLRLKQVKHGQIYDVMPMEVGSLYKSKDSIQCVRYHSLYVPKLNEHLIPLSNCVETDGKSILMGVRARDFPFYGVQYHPESVCSSNGSELIANFDVLAERVNKERKFSETLLENIVHLNSNESRLLRPLRSVAGSPNEVTLSFKLPTLENALPLSVCDYLRGKDDFFILNSAADPGTWSIIALPIEGLSEVVTHSIAETSRVIYSKFGSKDIDVHHTEVWSFIAELMSRRVVPRSQLEAQLPEEYGNIPFFGGFIGFISYEEGQHINFKKVPKDQNPDLKLIFIERFILHNNKTKQWMVILIKDGDEKWTKDYASWLEVASQAGHLSQENVSFACSIEQLSDGEILIEYPDKGIYNEQFELCQNYLHSGDSYELCLTTTAKITIPSKVDPWEMYKVLTMRNPAPYSSFMEFDDSILLSSLPERFLSWNDDENCKRVSLRPIKGTFKKTNSTTKEDAERALKIPKEMGENLMIVDLIRHDLHQFIPKVEVVSLMEVEEYRTVYQLVSVIEGNLNRDSPYCGMDILLNSLPPGSMTGAPKKRSVMLLQDIEHMQQKTGNKRGIYSGVSGYWSITDESDWSVVIRSLFSYRSEDTPTSQVWYSGAGGAITVLSKPEDEWEEMMTKYKSTLQAFKL